MKAIKVGDLITFNIAPSWRQQATAASMTTTASNTYPMYKHVLTAVVMATPEEFDGVIVLIWNGERMMEHCVTKGDIIKAITPYNELIEGL